MDEILSKRQGCHPIENRAASHTRTIAFTVAGVGIVFFLFVLCYTTWTLSLRKNLKAANQTLGNETAGTFTDFNTTEFEETDVTPRVTDNLQSNPVVNGTVLLTTPRPRRGRKKGNRRKYRKNYRKQIHELLSKLLGSGRVSSESKEDERERSRNGTTDRNRNGKPGRPKKNRFFLPGRRRKKNRNDHRKTSPQRSPDASAGKGRRKGDKLKGVDKRKGPGCKKKGECRRSRTQTKKGSKRGKTPVPTARTKQTGVNRKLETNRKLEPNASETALGGAGFMPRTNISSRSKITVVYNKTLNFTTVDPLVSFDTDSYKKTLDKNPGRLAPGHSLNQEENADFSPSLEPPDYPCPDEGNPRNQSQGNSSKPDGNPKNPKQKGPCLGPACNGTKSGDKVGTEPEASLTNRESDNGDWVGVVDPDDANGGDGVEEADLGYEKEEGWKPNMEKIFAEFERERNYGRLDSLQPVKWNQSKDTCDLWIRCKYNSLRHYLEQLDELPGCPCIYPDLVWNNQLWDDSKESYFSWETANSPIDRSDIYKPGAKFCIRSLLEPGMITLAAQHCCYDNNQQLITRGKAAGTPNLISPQISWELHRKVDILPWIICKGDWYRYHKVVPPNNSVMCKSNPEDTEFYRQVLDLKNI